jgi:hypothetical protein
MKNLNYVILEYNQDSEIEGTYTDNKFPIFRTEDELNKYLEENNIYGICQVYENNEYVKYLYEEDNYADIPEPIEEFNI